MAVSARHAFNVKQEIQLSESKRVGIPLSHLSRLPPPVLTPPSTCPTVISSGAVVIFAYV